MTFISHVSPDGQCPSKAPDPRAQECSSPKGKSTSFCEIEIFFFFSSPAFPKAGAQHLSEPVESPQLQALGSHLTLPI